MSSNFSSVGPAQAHKYIRTPLVPLTPLGGFSPHLVVSHPTWWFLTPLGGFSPHLVVSSLLLMQLHTNCTGNRLQSIERWMDRWMESIEGWMDGRKVGQAGMHEGRKGRR